MGQSTDRSDDTPVARRATVLEVVPAALEAPESDGKPEIDLAPDLKDYLAQNAMERFRVRGGR